MIIKKEPIPLILFVGDKLFLQSSTSRYYYGQVLQGSQTRRIAIPLKEIENIAVQR